MLRFCARLVSCRPATRGIAASTSPRDPCSEFYDLDLESGFFEDIDDRDGAKDNVIMNDDDAVPGRKKLLHHNARGHCHIRYALFGKSQR